MGNHSVVIALALLVVGSVLTNRRTVPLQQEIQDAERPPAETSTEEAPVMTTSLMRQVATAYFPLDPETGKIKLEADIDSVVVDVGARESDYLKALEVDKQGKLHGNRTAVFLVDPLPSSVVPVTARVSQYAVQTKRWNQAFVLRAAMGKKEGRTSFQVGSAPACSSILQTSAKNKFWCAETTERIETVVFRLEDFLELLPSSVLGSVNLKVDAEGADLDVLKGAGDRIAAFDTIIIECNPPNGTETFRDGECTFEDAKAYMETMGFNTTSYDIQGGLVNMYFVNLARSSSSSGIQLPTYFRSSSLVFRDFYKQFSTIDITAMDK